MIRSIKSLIGFTIGATDGEIGKVKEFYFDDGTWNIRYLIVDTGNWLSGRIVLISPESLLAPDWENKVFPVNLNKEQIKNCPDIDTKITVPRQLEVKLNQRYPWSGYWGCGVSTAGMVSTVIFPDEQKQTDDNKADKETEYGLNLRSTDIVTGYCIKASDGEIGDVDDFLIDDSTWKISLLVVDTGNWFPGKKVLLTPVMIKKIEWTTTTVYVNTSVDQVTNSPDYSPSQSINEVFTRYIYKYYGQVPA